MITMTELKHFLSLFKPALLYIVPSCLIIPLGLALIKGDIKQMFNYRDHEDQDGDATGSQNTSTSSATNSTANTPTPSPKASAKETKKIN